MDHSQVVDLPDGHRDVLLLLLLAGLLILDRRRRGSVVDSEF